MGIGCGAEGAKTLLQSACPIALRCCQDIHEVAGCFPVFLVLERHVEVRGGSEHVQERPQRKALVPVLLKAEIDPAVLDAGSKGVGSNPGEVGGGEVALQQIVKLHDRFIVG